MDSKPLTLDSNLGPRDGRITSRYGCPVDGGCSCKRVLKLGKLTNPLAREQLHDLDWLALQLRYVPSPRGFGLGGHQSCLACRAYVLYGCACVRY